MRALPSFDPRRAPLRWLLRLPIPLYRLGLGCLLGGRFVLLTVRGRRTGLLRPVVLEVLGPDPQTGGIFVASAWGGSAQWLRNLEVCPNAQAQVGHRSFPAEVLRLPEQAGEEQLRSYAKRHPLAGRVIFQLLLGREPLGTEDKFAILSRSVPILLVRPTP
jgi:deazaflavin-dependent oxidoreductase (nitroreductase family)